MANTTGGTGLGDRNSSVVASAPTPSDSLRIVDIGSILGDAPLRGLPILVLALSFIVIMLDGYDLICLSFVAPWPRYSIFQCQASVRCSPLAMLVSWSAFSIPCIAGRCAALPRPKRRRRLWHTRHDQLSLAQLPAFWLVIPR